AALFVQHAVRAHLGIPRWQPLGGHDADTEEALGHLEGAFEHAIGREVLTELLLVEREAFAPELLGEIGYVPRFEDVGTSASARELGELAVLSFERRARLLGE